MTCSKCGSWYIRPIGGGSALCADSACHVGEFFTAFHMKSCGGAVSNEPFHSSNSPDHSKGIEWDPNTCPDFRPYSEAFVRHTTDLGRKLLGGWFHNGGDFESPQYRTLFFGEGGSGKWYDWTVVDPWASELYWHIDPLGVLVVQVAESSKPAAGLWELVEANGSRFELITYTRPYGKPEDYLLLFREGEKEPSLLSRCDRMPSGPDLSKWETVSETEDSTILRLHPDYVAGIFGRLLDLRFIMLAQMEAVRKRAEEQTAAAQPEHAESRSIEDEVAAAMAAPRQIGNLWIMADGLGGVFSHLALPNGCRFACVFSAFETVADICTGQTRIVVVKPCKAQPLDAPPLELRHADLRAAAPPGLPDWILWQPCEIVACDDEPPAVFEKSLLQACITELLSPGPQFFYDGVLVTNSLGAFLDTTIALPLEVAPADDARPLVAFASKSLGAKNFLPARQNGHRAIGSAQFTYLEFYTCERGVGNLTPPMPGHSIVGFRRKREWYIHGKLVWTESDQETGFGDPFGFVSLNDKV